MKLNRRDFVKTAGAVSAMAAIGRKSEAARATIGDKPNIMFINLDQMSIRAIAGYGCPDVETPHIDRLMSQGYSFRNSYSACPVCGPARTTWQTGRMPSEHGTVKNGMEFKMLQSLPDMGRWLREQAGYRPYHTGKWHVYGRWAHESYYVLAEGTMLCGENGDIPVTRSVEGFLKNYNEPNPFLLVCGLMNPHDICMWIPQHDDVAKPPEWLLDQLPPLPNNFGNATPECETMAAMRNYNLKNRNTKIWSDDMWRFYRWAYYRYVEMVDECVGQILDAVDQSPYRDNTLLIFSADHGDTFGAHKGMLMKDNFYEESVAVPFVCRFPGHIPAGVLDEETLMFGCDLLPTICDYAGIAPPDPEHQPGLSLRTVLERGEKPDREAVFSEVLVNGRMVRTKRYKYIHFKGEKTEMLFDLQNDPGELVNLAYSPEHKTVLERHQKLQRDFENSLVPKAEDKAQ
jgi:arylsulfatase A-like enzyme